jgi:hypothetical protein
LNYSIIFYGLQGAQRPDQPTIYDICEKISEQLVNIYYIREAGKNRSEGKKKKIHLRFYSRRILGMVEVRSVLVDERSLQPGIFDLYIGGTKSGISVGIKTAILS